LGRQQPRVCACDGDGSTGFGRTESGARLRTASTRLRRRTAHSGDERKCTSDERGVLEGEATSSRQEWGGSAVPFYREREGRGMVCQRRGNDRCLHGYHWWRSSLGEVMGETDALITETVAVIIPINTEKQRTTGLAALGLAAQGSLGRRRRGRLGGSSAAGGRHAAASGRASRGG
jgi:hypothetical protein